MKHFDFDDRFLLNFPKKYRRQTHLEPISCFPGIEPQQSWNIIKDLRKFYEKEGVDLYAETVPGTTWGLNMWPGEGTLLFDHDELFNKIIKKIVKKIVTNIEQKDREEYSVNLTSKLGYPFFTNDKKLENVEHVLSNIDTYLNMNLLNTVLNRNQLEKRIKERTTNCPYGYVIVNNKIDISDFEHYKYDSEADILTMRMRLVFNYSALNFVSLCMDQAIHTYILRTEELMHFDMSRINTELNQYLNYREVTNEDELLKIGDEEDIVIALDAERFDEQNNRDRQNAYGEGIGSNYREVQNKLLDSYYFLEGTVMGSSFLEIIKKEDNRAFRSDVKWPTFSGKEVWANWVSKRDFYLKLFKDVQLGSGISYVSSFGKVIFQAINHIYTCEVQGIDPEITEYTSYNRYEWISRFGILPLSYGDDQFYFGKARSVRRYLQVARKFIKLNVETLLTFLGFGWINGVGFKLTKRNYMKNEIGPEHEFGSHFRRFPAIGLLSKDHDYKMLGTSDIEDFIIRHDNLLKEKGFDKKRFIELNLSEEKRLLDIEGKLLNAFSWKLNLNKIYLMTKKEKALLGLYGNINQELIDKTFTYLKS